MAKYSTLKHSKTLGKTQISIFGTLTSTLALWELCLVPKPIHILTSEEVLIH